MFSFSLFIVTRHSIIEKETIFCKAKKDLKRAVKNKMQQYETLDPESLKSKDMNEINKITL